VDQPPRQRTTASLWSAPTTCPHRCELQRNARGRGSRGGWVQLRTGGRTSRKDNAQLPASRAFSSPRTTTERSAPSSCPHRCGLERRGSSGATIWDEWCCRTGRQIGARFSSQGTRTARSSPCSCPYRCGLERGWSGATTWGEWCGRNQGKTRAAVSLSMPIIPVVAAGSMACEPAGTSSLGALQVEQRESCGIAHVYGANCTCLR
jgi:hypothetical protein